MKGRRPVLGPRNGNLDAKIMFIAEAPGRLGAEIYRVPLYGDASGKNFDQFLLSSGLSRDDIFITNSVLCNPQNDNNLNRKPSIHELHNCIYFLTKTVEVISPKIIVPLGSNALRSINIIFKSNYQLKSDIASAINLDNRYTLFPLYHPSPLALIRRPKSLQLQDYDTLKEIMANDKQ